MPAEAAMFELLAWAGVAAFLALIVLAVDWFCNKAEQDLFGDDKGDWR